MRTDIKQQRSRLVPLRDIAVSVREAGYSVSKDALARHFEHVAPLDPAELHSDSSSLLVAREAAVVLSRWPTLASEIANRLASAGALEAAALLRGAAGESGAFQPPWVPTRLEVLDDLMRRLRLDGQSAAELIREAHALTSAVSTVLSSQPPEISTAMAQHCRGLGEEELAEALMALAAKAAHLGQPTSAMTAAA